MPDVKCAICDCWKSSTECKSLSSATYAWFHRYLRSKRRIFDLNELYYCKWCTSALYKYNEEKS